LRSMRFLIGAAIAYLPVLCQAQPAPVYTISAAVGNGTAGFSGDGSSAVSAEVNFPSAVVVDSSGNLYIADQANYRIRKVDTSGNISTIAGNGTKGNAGDGKAATSANIGSAGGIAVDSSGNVYFADTANHVVRKIATGGTITTIAGTGTPGFSGDTTEATLAADAAAGRTAPHLATSATLNSPTGVAVDSKGNVYISDTTNNRIRRVSVTDQTITTVAGDGTGNYYGDGAGAVYSEINHPVALFFDASDNLYIADSLNHRIRKISGTDGTISTVAGLGRPGNADNGGYAVNSELHYPSSVSVDKTGNIYIADFINNRVRIVNTSGVISTIAGGGKFGNGGDGGPALAAQTYFPCSVAVDASGKVYMIDSLNSRIRLLTPDSATGTPTDAAPGSTNTPALPVRHVQPHPERSM
jgi:trimeric autotransporter adhesin